MFLMDLLENFKENNADINYVYFASKTKKMHNYPFVEFDAAFDPTTRPWYIEAVKNKGKVIVNEFYKDAKTGEATVTLAKAVEYKGEIQGVVAMDLNMNKVSKNLSNIKLGEQGYVVITDSKGTVITHPKEELIGTDIVTTLSYWDNVKTTEKGFNEYTYEGIKKYNVHTTSFESGWKILGAINEEELMKDVKAIRNAILTFGLIVGLVTVIISAFIARKITFDLSKLGNAFNKAAEGDLSVKVNIKSKDEFEDLGNHFNV